MQFSMINILFFTAMAEADFNSHLDIGDHLAPHTSHSLHLSRGRSLPFSYQVRN